MKPAIQIIIPTEPSQRNESKDERYPIGSTLATIDNTTDQITSPSTENAESKNQQTRYLFHFVLSFS